MRPPRASSGGSYALHEGHTAELPAVNTLLVVWCRFYEDGAPNVGSPSQCEEPSVAARSMTMSPTFLPIASPTSRSLRK